MSKSDALGCYLNDLFITQQQIITFLSNLCCGVHWSKRQKKVKMKMLLYIVCFFIVKTMSIFKVRSFQNSWVLFFHQIVSGKILTLKS